MQNKQAIIGIIAAAVILLGAGSVYLLNKNKSETQPSTSTKTEQTAKTTSQSGSLKDIFANGGNKKCTFSTKTETSETLGTFYVSGTNTRGSMVATSNGKSTTTNIVRNGDTFYIWGDSLPTGMKITMSVDEMSSKIGQGQTSAINPDAKVDFKCGNWSVDSSLFTPPSSVKFIDASNVIKGVTGTQTAPSSASQCSLCSSLTGAAKTSCMTSFHCQ